MGNVDKYFCGGVGQKEIMKYLATQSFESQALAIHGTSAENIKDTGTKGIMINGVVIPTLPVDAELDVSADTTGDAAGTVVADGSSQFFAVLAIADGTLSVWKAGVAATTGNEVLKIPAFDPTTYVCIGLMLVAASGAAATIGTTALTGICTFYQVVGPVFPHPDNLVNA